MCVYFCVCVLYSFIFFSVINFFKNKSWFLVLISFFFFCPRDSFPFDQQFNILMRFIVDQTQTPNLKVSGCSPCFSRPLFPVWLVMCQTLHSWEHLCSALRGHALVSFGPRWLVACVGRRLTLVPYSVLVNSVFTARAVTRGSVPC